MAPLCYQVNLQLGLGGGEVYTRFFSEALQGASWETCVFVHPRGALRRELVALGIPTLSIVSVGDLVRQRLEPRAPFISHGPLPQAVVSSLRSRGHRLACIAHMPMRGRDPAPFRHCDLVVPVSRYVRDGLLEAGIVHTYPEPLYGVAHLDRGDGGGIVRRSPYAWDRRKARDRLLGWLYPLGEPFRRRVAFERRPGVTFGIVSRLTPIKQFPLLFRYVAPVFAQYPRINLEIFGNGGYASLRDLRASLAPMRRQVRFWGGQDDVAAVYRQLDYMLAGLPDKEALGLNVIEAQFCGTPVVAVGAPPFTETVLDGVTGWLFADPRYDGGASLRELLDDLAGDGRVLDRSRAERHLARFSVAAFQERVGRLLQSPHWTG